MLILCLAGCGSASETSKKSKDKNDTKKDTVVDTVTDTSVSSDNEKSPSDGPDFFESYDIYGNYFNSDILGDAKVIMINYWEPWCGPCVNEMPDLQKLYEKYKDQGFVVVGIYSTFDMDEDALAIVEGANITYPILRETDVMHTLAQDYYPASYFMNGSQYLIDSNPYIGSRSYDDWESIILSYLY